MSKAQRQAYDNKIRMQRILELLNQNLIGLTVKEIVNQTNLSRQAVTKALSTLKMQNKINKEEYHWKLNTNITKSNQLYPNFDEEHEQWVKEVKAKKIKPNPHERN